MYALGMSQPESLDELVKVGNNLFQPLGNVAAGAAGRAQHPPGLSGNVRRQPVRQMMAMIETTRAFEANTRMIQNQDTMIGALISRVLQA